MTREQRNTLYRQIEYLTRVKDTFDQDLCEILNGIVANLPVADPAPVGETVPAPTELEAAVGELCRLVEDDEYKPDITAAIARVRAAMRNVAGQKGAER